MVLNENSDYKWLFLKYTLELHFSRAIGKISFVFSKPPDTAFFWKSQAFFAIIKVISDVFGGIYDNCKNRSYKKSKKDELRIQIINQYHLFTDIQQNPLLAWSEMEFHAFDQLVQDYEHLGGNDFVHDTVLPAMNNLEIVLMSDIRRLEEVMSARHAR